MTSRMKLALHFQRCKGAPGERSTQPQLPHTESEELASSSDEQDQHRRASIGTARDFIYDLIRSDDRWSSHLPLIRINCPYSFNELHALGNLTQFEGVAACRKLVRVPVIHEELGLFIWTQLAPRAHGCNLADTLASKVAAADTHTRRADEALLVHLDDRFQFDEQSASASERGRRSGSTPVSPTDVHRQSLACLSSSAESRRRARSTQPCRGCYRRASIEKCDEGLATMRGRIVSRSVKGPPATHRGIESQRSSCSSAAGTDDSRVSSSPKRCSRHETPSIASQAASVNRSRSGSLVGRLGSAVGELRNRVVGVMSEGLSFGYEYHPQNRNRPPTSV